MADVLTEAGALIHGDRQRTYGNVRFDYERVTGLFEHLTGRQLSVEQGLLFMVCVKLARLGHNLMDTGQLHRDSLVDAIGYLALLEKAYITKEWQPHYAPDA